MWECGWQRSVNQNSNSLLPCLYWVHLSLFFKIYFEEMMRRHLIPLHSWSGQDKALYNHEECIPDWNQTCKPDKKIGYHAWTLFTFNHPCIKLEITPNFYFRFLPIPPPYKSPSIYQCTYSSYCVPYISYHADKENLFNN